MRVWALAVLAKCDPASPTKSIRLRPLDVALGDTKAVQSDGHEMQVTKLSEDPLIFTVKNFMDKADRTALVKLAKREEQFGSVMLGSGSTRSWRVSTQSWVRKDLSAKAPMPKLTERIAAVLGVSPADVRAGHPAQVLRYDPGGRYLPHFDSRHRDELYPSAERADYKTYGVYAGYPYAARAATMFCVLKEAPSGGQTLFPLVSTAMLEYPSRKKTTGMSSRNPQAESIWERHMPSQCNGTADDGSLSVNPGAGNCVLFFNHLLEDGVVGELNRRSMHAGCPVLKGTKWGINFWLETQPPFSTRKSSEL